jgi:predicted RND superfamily exporter protein
MAITFRKWLLSEGDRYPTRNIHEKIARFITSGFDHFRDNFFFEDGVIKAWTLNVKLQDRPGYLEVQNLTQIYDDFAVEMFALAPGKGFSNREVAGDVLHVSSLWVETELTTRLATSGVWTVITALGCGLLAVLGFTQSGSAALGSAIVAGVSLLCVVACMGTLGYTIGPIAILTFVVVLGYSVTYSIHIAHAFVDACRKTTEADLRVRFALLRLGPPTIAAAFTTVFSCVVLLAAVSPVFVQFGVVLLLTTAFGAAFALFTLPALLTVTYARCRCCLRQQRRSVLETESPDLR